MNCSHHTILLSLVLTGALPEPAPAPQPAPGAATEPASIAPFRLMPLDGPPRP